MVPIDHSITKEVALSLAVEYATSRPRYNPQEVTEIAELFLIWLTYKEEE